MKYAIYRVRRKHINRRFAAQMQKLVDQLDAERSKQTVKKLQRVVSMKGTVLYVAATKEGVLVGTVGVVTPLSPTYSPPFLSDLVVDKDYRRTGVGGALLTEALNYAREKGHEAILAISNPGREEARPFYLSFAFHELPTRILYRTI